VSSEARRGIAKLAPAIDAAAIALAFWALRVGADRVFFDALPESLYRHPVIALGIAGQPLLAAVGLASLLPLVRRASLGWSAIDAGRGLRILAMGVVLAIAWDSSTYGYNHYYARSHLVDRLLLLALGVGVWRNAAWIPAFTVQYLILLSQFAHPMGMHTYPPAERTLAHHLVLLLAGFVALRGAASWIPALRTPRPAGSQAFVVVLCVIAASYFLPGLEKIRISPDGTEWVLDNDLSWLLVEASRHGWRMGLSAEHLDLVRSAVSAWSPVLLAGSLVLELGAVLLVVRARLSLVILAALTGFHVVTTLVSGFFFWKWIVVDAAAGVAIWSLREADRRRVFAPRNVALSLLLIPLAFYYQQPNPLGWFDRPYGYLFRVELIDDKDKRYSTDPSAFAPYELVFAYDRFNYLMKRKALRGKKKYQVKWELQHGGPEGVDGVRRRHGHSRYSERARRRLDAFFVSYFESHNRNPRALWWLRPLQPPPFQVRWVNRDPDPYSRQGDVRRVRVRYVEEYFRGSAVFPLRDSVLHEVEIPR
jgi:hypothetical protein